MLRARGITRRFPGVLALDGVDLDVRAGEIHALVGENGAGKSTLVGVLGGAHAPDQGTVELDGAPLPLGDPLACRRAGVGIIYQEFTLVPELGVADNVFLGRERTRRGLLERGAMRAEARTLLDQLGVRADPAARTGSLNVGSQQLVEVARALATEARLLVFDEPSATLTEAELEHLFATLRSLRERGLALVYISHRLEEIFAIADRVTVLRDGRTVSTAAVADIDRRQLIRWMVGREVDEAAARRPHAPGAVVLEAQDLASPPCFERASLSVRRGEVVGLAGLVGAGRTSVGLALSGALPLEAGTLRLGGRPVAFAHPADALAAGVGYLTEDRKRAGIVPGLPIWENVTLSTLSEFTRGGLLDERRRRAAAEADCARFTVRMADADRPIRTLSGGNQQKALLARLMRRPLRVVVLDEPTRGVDVGARAEVYGIVEELLEAGLAVIVISSDLPELLLLCDRIVVMHEGRTVGELPRSEATQEAIMALATGEGSP